MPIRSISVQGYRSVQRARVRLGQVNVLVGANGCGKSNLYRSLFLLHAAADGQLARTLALEGGMPSALWAGEQRKGTPKRITIEVTFDQWSYRFSCGLSTDARPGSVFLLDPAVRREELWFLDRGRRTSVFRRDNASAQLRDDAGSRVQFPMALSESESILSELREPHRYPELSALRSVLLGWRFYHQFRTDDQSPLRRPQIAVRTPVLGHDSADLAAALLTIQEIGAGDVLGRAVAHAFADARLEVLNRAGMQVVLEMPEFRRPFLASELSDGTLKYLCLLAALLSPRPAPLLAINEPDANLHPQLFEPLAQMCAHAAHDSQLWITTHSQHFAELLQTHADAVLIQLTKENGATQVAGSSMEDLSFDEDGDDAA